jgi:hypothetical protein
VSAAESNARLTFSRCDQFFARDTTLSGARPSFRELVERPHRICLHNASPGDHRR